MLDRRACGHGFVHGALELNLAATAVARVLRQDSDTSRIVDAISDRVGRKSAEDHGVDRADPRAGQQSNRQFRRHAHVDGDPVTLLDAQ